MCAEREREKRRSLGDSRWKIKREESLIKLRSIHFAAAEHTYIKWKVIQFSTLEQIFLLLLGCRRVCRLLSSLSLSVLTFNRALHLLGCKTIKLFIVILENFAYAISKVKKKVKTQTKGEVAIVMQFFYDVRAKASSQGLTSLLTSQTHMQIGVWLSSRWRLRPVVYFYGILAFFSLWCLSTFFRHRPVNFSLSFSMLIDFTEFPLSEQLKMTMTSQSENNSGGKIIDIFYQWFMILKYGEERRWAKNFT